MLGKLFIAWSGLAIANFIFELISDKKWGEALDRSIFQAIAIIVFAITMCHC